MAKLMSVKLADIEIPDVRVSSIHTKEQKALMASTIAEIGLVQDIVLRVAPGGKYKLISGRGRLLELIDQGHTEYDMKVVEADDKLALIMNITENVARGSYDYVSISKAIRELKARGVSMEELERIFPWRKAWIEFIEDLQDLPDDVTDALRSQRIVPTHISVAAKLPTPEEAHDGIRTAMRLGWNTATLKIFVENRNEQIERARARAQLQGVAPEIPVAQPEVLINYKQCLCCGYKKLASEVLMTSVCEGCLKLARYLTDQIGTPEETMKYVYNALVAYQQGLKAQSKIGSPGQQSVEETRPFEV